MTSFTSAAIRGLFLQPKPTYAIAETATLLAMEWQEVRGWVEVGIRTNLTSAQQSVSRHAGSVGEGVEVERGGVSGDVTR